VVLKTHQIDIPSADVILSSSHSPQGAPTKDISGSSYSYQQFFTPLKDPVVFNGVSITYLPLLLYQNKNFCNWGSVQNAAAMGSVLE
jgi:hypothetical protein